MQPDLSVIIPSYRRTDLLATCLGSLKRHATHNLQILVVDDASPGACVTRTAKTFPAVEVARLRKRTGFCGAVNAGLRAALAPVVQVLNDDTEVLPGWAQTPPLRLRQAARVAAVAPLVLRWPDGEVIDSAGDEYDAGGFAYSRGRGRRLSPEWLQPCEVFSAAGSAAFYRREVLLNLGGFPEDFGAYFDDVDVGFRLRRAGYRCRYEPASRILHHGSASHGRCPRRRLAEQLARNEERVFCRHLPHERRLRLLTRHAAVLGAKGIRRWADGTLLPFLLGRVRAWVEAVLSSRRYDAAGRDRTMVPGATSG